MDKLYLNSCAVELRHRYREDEYSPVDIFALVTQEPDITLVFYPLGENISGICIKEVKLIAINSQMSYGRQRFSLAHELYHMYYEETTGTNVSGMGLGVVSGEEAKADQFASYFLAPYNSLREKIGGNPLSIARVIDLEQHFGMSHKAMLFRLRDEGYISNEEYEHMNSGVTKRAQFMGYSDALYLPSAKSQQQLTLGKYIRLAEELQKQDKISVGKYEELLMDAFRTDLVYGISEENGGEVFD